jgi:hypothetical protein
MQGILQDLFENQPGSRTSLVSLRKKRKRGTDNEEKKDMKKVLLCAVVVMAAAVFAQSGEGSPNKAKSNATRTLRCKYGGWMG